MNRFVHPRNYFKIHRPDFAELALKYPELKQHLVPGSIHQRNRTAEIDFTNADAVRCLTKAILFDWLGIDLVIPDGALIPTVTLRLNYILFLEDILYAFGIVSDPPVAVPKSTVCLVPPKPVACECTGLDIGCGSTCIYALLACTLNRSWRMLTTESFKLSYDTACENVKKNNLEGLIHVVFTTCTDPDKLLRASQFVSADGVDFIMCNPPFFPSDELELNARRRKHGKSELESSAKRQRSDSEQKAGENTRLPPVSLPTESVYPGGEIVFVQQLISEGRITDWSRRAKIYSSMLGHKDSVMPVLEFAERAEASAIYTEFCQGRTVRWCVWWSWRYDLNFMPFNEPITKFRHQKWPVTHHVIDFQPASVSTEQKSSSASAFHALIPRLEGILIQLKLEFSLECRVNPLIRPASDSFATPADKNDIKPHLTMNGVEACKFLIIDKRERSLKKSRQRAARKKRALITTTNTNGEPHCESKQQQIRILPSASDEIPKDKAHLRLLLYVIRNTLCGIQQDAASYDHMCPADKYLIKAKVLDRGEESFFVSLVDSIVSRLKQ